MRTWKLGELRYEEVREAGFEVAVLPLGATEPHNLHLPYATDTLEVERIADESARRATEQGARVVVLPALPYGTETNLSRFPLAMNLNPTTVAAVIRDLVGSLEASGIRKCLILNGHGGNDLKWILRELYGKTSVHLFLSNWYTVGEDCYDELFEDPGDHAGELETSMGLAYFADLVRLDRADAGGTRPTRLEAVNRGWVTITRPWHLLTTQSGAGDPRPASAEKGRRLLDLVATRLARFLVELSEAELDETFPF
ncbi:MAG: amidase [Isosphaeraceae bacterium]|jgi:creatinine amidohydrolase|nr:MAG: amidase [Isosphaeraceae bacterium]